jgi:WD40 repeat protein
LRGHVAPVYRLSWSCDSRLLVSASKDSTLKVRSHSSFDRPFSINLLEFNHNRSCFF